MAPRIRALGARLRHCAEPTASRLGQQAPDRPLGLLVGPLAEVHQPHPARAVDQVVGRPVLVVVGGPGAVVVVLGDRVGEAEVPDRALDVRGLLLERELGRVDADHGEPVAMVFAVPGLDVRKGPDAVDARVGPEVDQHDPSPQPREAERLVVGRVEPLLGVGELRRFEQHREPLSRGGLGGAALMGRLAAAPQTGERLRRRSSSARSGWSGSTRAEGRWRAIAASNRTSRLAIMTAATATITAPIATWTAPRWAPSRSVDPAAADDQDVEHQGRAQRVCESDRQPAEGEVLRRRDGDHAGEDRAGARRVDEPQAGPDARAPTRTPRRAAARAPARSARSMPRAGRPAAAPAAGSRRPRRVTIARVRTGHWAARGRRSRRRARRWRR